MEHEVGPKRFRTIEDYLDEINSKAFRAGVDKSIRHTQKYGFETAFGLTYFDKNGLWEYPQLIDVGEKDSVDECGWDARRVNDYCEQKGKDVKDLWQEIIETKELTTQLDFPHKYLGQQQTTIFDPRLNIDDIKGVYFDLIHFHTHPYREGRNNVTASRSDLRVLNHTRRIASQIHNPISVIIGVTERKISKRKFPFIIFQEKTEIPLPTNFDFDIIQKGMGLSMEEAFLKNFKYKGVLDAYNLAKDNYNIEQGHYIIGRGFMLNRK